MDYVYFPGETGFRTPSNVTMYAIWQPCSHSWNSGTVTKVATCTSAGTKTYTCTVCCETKTETISALGHNYGSWTKLNDTQHQRVCSRDNSHVEKANHTWNSGTVTTQPTCTNVGIKTYTCTACSATKTETVAAKGHTSQSVSAVAATCTEKGKTAGTKCSVCGVTLSGLAETPALGHDYKATVTTQPTCTTEGVKTYKCSRCTSSYTEKISATGHTQETRNAVAPTCTQEGYTGDVYCKVCDELLEEGISIPKAAHEFVDGVCLNCGAEDPDFDAPSIESAEGSDIVVDKDNAIIYGFSDTPYCEDDILNNFEVVGTGVTAEIVPTENGYGTGTIINLLVNDEIVDSYAVIIFGDATGDGIIDESDFVMIDLYNAMLYFPEEDSPEFLGMDCNRDGVVDESDIVLVDLTNAFMGEIDQVNGGILFY